MWWWTKARLCALHHDPDDNTGLGPELNYPRAIATHFLDDLAPAAEGTGPVRPDASVTRLIDRKGLARDGPHLSIPLAPDCQKESCYGSVGWAFFDATFECVQMTNPIVFASYFEQRTPHS